MTRRNDDRVEIVLAYTGGEDEPERGVFRNYPVEPRHTDELVVAIRSEEDPIANVPYNAALHGAPQVHLAGSPRALEEFGKFLIALARLKTADPEPSLSLDDVINADGGTLRLLPRRIAGPSSEDGS